ncbi:MAG: matrixin family metalloprotease [Myxococcota bacterium]
MRRAAPLLALLIAGSFPKASAAFLCSTEKDNETLTQVWMSRCIPYWLSLHGTLLDNKQLLVGNCFDQWANNACTDLEFKYVDTTSEVAAFDELHPLTNQNVIASIESESEWVDADKNALDPGLLAITLTTYLQATGEIIDADILVHASGFKFEDVSDQVACMGARTPPFDLRNTLTHEMGHWIGFAHSPVVGSTMEASARQCEIQKRDLAQDDKDGVCTVYPKGQATATCKPPTTYTPAGLDVTPFRNQCDPGRGSMMSSSAGGCSCGASEAPGALTWLLSLGAARWITLRRSRCIQSRRSGE